MWIFEDNLEIIFLLKRWLWPKVDMNGQHEAEGINIDRGPQPTLNTENPWLNVIIIHSKFISSPFTSLFSTIFQYFLNHSLSYIVTNTGKSATEMNTRSGLSVMSPSMLFEIDR